MNYDAKNLNKVDINAGFWGAHLSFLGYFISLCSWAVFLSICFFSMYILGFKCNVVCIFLLYMFRFYLRR